MKFLLLGFVIFKAFFLPLVLPYPRFLSDDDDKDDFDVDDVDNYNDKNGKENINKDIRNTDITFKQMEFWEFILYFRDLLGFLVRGG